MTGLAEDCVDRARLDDFTLIQHADLVCHIRDHAQIVRDDHHGHTKLALQLHDELQNLRLNGHIKCGRRFVGDQQHRVTYQSHGDHRALPQTAREFKRIGLYGSRRVGKPNQPQHLHHRIPSLCLAQRPVQRQGLFDLVAYRVQRGKGRHRLLENDRNTATPQRPDLRIVRLQLGNVHDDARTIWIGKQDFPTLDARNPGQDAHDGLRNDRFARSRFAHQRDSAPFRNAERNTVSRLDRPGVHVQIDLEIPYLENVRHVASS